MKLKITMMFAAFGVDPHRYVAPFTEGLVLMKALWTDSRVTSTGSSGSCKMRPWNPSRSRSFPADLVRRVRATAVRLELGHGFFGAGSSPTARFADQVQIVRQALAESGLADGLPIAKRVYIAVGENSQ